MAEAKPVQPFADRAAMHAHAMHRGEFGHDLVQRQITLDHQPVPHPTDVGGQLALGMIALFSRRKAPAFALQDHHVIDELRRNPEVPRRFPMSVPLLHKRDNTTAKLHRM
jgi:hypothetical protein